MTRATAPPRTSLASTALAVVLTSLFLAALVVGLIIRASSAMFGPADAAGLVPLLVAQGVGLLLATRRPENSVGWIVCGLAWTLAVQTLLTAYVLRPGAGVTPVEVAAAWVDGKGFLLLWAGIIALFFHFPTGRLPSPGWRWPWRLAMAGVALGTLAFALAPRPVREDFPVSPTNPMNPTAVTPGLWEQIGVIEPVAMAMLLAGLVASLVSLVVRYRQSPPVPRLQIRWVVTAAVVLAAALLLNVALRNIAEQWLEVGDLVAGFAFALLPLSVGVAILRHRLYEIDRILSRTLSWLLVSAVIAAVYVGGVSLLTATVAPRAGDSPAAVAASTLIAAAAFRPTRARIQQAVDRRFNRSRYDAARTVESFSARLRDEVDISTLQVELLRVVSATMQPGGVSLWLREAGR